MPPVFASGPQDNQKSSHERAFPGATAEAQTTPTELPEITPNPGAPEPTPAEAPAITPQPPQPAPPETPPREDPAPTSLPPSANKQFPEGKYGTAGIVEKPGS
jgi:hypothetical protein